MAAIVFVSPLNRSVAIAVFCFSDSIEPSRVAFSCESEAS